MGHARPAGCDDRVFGFLSKLNEIGREVEWFWSRPGRSFHGRLSADRAGRQRSGTNDEIRRVPARRGQSAGGTVQAGFGLEIAHEWRGWRTNGENVGFFHSCALNWLPHEWADFAHEWTRSRTNGENVVFFHSCRSGAFRHDWVEFRHEWGRSVTNGETPTCRFN